MVTNTNRPAQTKAAANTGALEMVHLRNEFFRDNFRTLALVLAVLVTALLVSVATNIILATRKPTVQNFTVDSAGRITPIVPTDKPYVSQSTLKSWVSEKVVRAYTMDPKNFRSQIDEMADDFTPDGLAQYKKSLIDSGTIDLIQKNLLISSATTLGVPVMIEEGTVGDVYFWKLEVPILVQYASAIKSAERRRVVTITVVRRDTRESKAGIGINQFVAYDR